jgi:hypothetical protein
MLTDLHFLHNLHFSCGTIAYGVQILIEPTSNLHPVSHCVTTKVQDVKVVQVCPPLRFHITELVRVFFLRWGSWGKV